MLFKLTFLLSSIKLLWNDCLFFKNAYSKQIFQSFFYQLVQKYVNFYCFEKLSKVATWRLRNTDLHWLDLWQYCSLVYTHWIELNLHPLEPKIYFFIVNGVTKVTLDIFGKITKVSRINPNFVTSFKMVLIWNYYGYTISD